MSFFVGVQLLAKRLIEETETHVLVGLLLLLLLLFGLGLLSGGSAASGSTTSATAATAAGWDGGKLLRAGGDQLVDVLALELAEELLQALVIGLNVDRVEDAL